MRVHLVADIFPRMTATEYAALRDDIKAHGQREPIWVFDGQIIDGRHRAQACEELGIEPAVREYDGDESGLVGFVVSLNLHRRHLDDDQRRMVGAKIVTMTQGRPAETSQIANISREQAAALVNADVPGIDRARKVVKHGAPELVAAVESGKVSVSAAAAAAALPTEEQREVVAEIEAGERPAEVIKRHVHVAQNGGNNEWYTPSRYIDGARRVMGGIDTDPATSEIANRVIGAETWFTESDDGREQEWRGRVWMNPPYAQPLIADFCDALAEKFKTGEVEQACVLVNNGTETAWFQRLLSVASAVALPRGRVRFLDPSGAPSGAPLQGQALIYCGPNWRAFSEEFSADGAVLVQPGCVNG